MYTVKSQREVKGILSFVRCFCVAEGREYPTNIGDLDFANILVSGILPGFNPNSTGPLLVGEAFFYYIEVVGVYYVVNKVF